MDEATGPPEMVGAALVPILLVLVVWVVARLFKRGRTPRSFFTIAFWTLAVLFVIDLAGLVGQAAGSLAVTDADRAGLEIGEDSIRHAGLGFVLPSPGPGFAADSELQALITQQYAGQGAMVAWGLRDPNQSALVLIQVTKGKQTEPGFRAFARGMKRGVTESGRARILEDTLRWQDGKGEYQVTFMHENGVYSTMLCRGGRFNTVSRVVCVQTSSLERDGLAFVRAGFSLR
jgi:hypothetical protein